MQTISKLARRFQFTLNEFDKYPVLVDAIKSKVHYKAMISCRETAPSTGHVHAHIVTSASAYVRLMFYIMYIPEGVWKASTAADTTQRYFDDGSTLSDLVTRHPEWILAWRQFGTDFVTSDTNLDRVTFSSRLKRNLNSGDQICAVMVAYKEDAAGTGNINRLMIAGSCQFWTCAN